MLLNCIHCYFIHSVCVYCILLHFFVKRNYWIPLQCQLLLFIGNKLERPAAITGIKIEKKCPFETVYLLAL